MVRGMSASDPIDGARAREASERAAAGPGADLAGRAPEKQAGSFQATRDAHRSEVSEDYVELIADLIGQTGEARPVDIAKRLGVSQPTVTNKLSQLQRDGLVVRRPYRSVFLTETGQALAEACRRRHRIVVSFLVALGIDEATAEQDAEGIEHHVSDHTLAVFERFIAKNS
jgi:DtxR family manganese transport transcriptional regulator